MTFPTTGLLDAFGRANENPLANGTWTSLIQTNDAAGMQLNSNHAEGTTVTTHTGSYWSAANFGPDSECFFDVTHILSAGASFFNCWVRIQNPNSANLNGYVLNINSANAWKLYKAVSNTLTLMQSPTQTVSNGDKVGLDVIGTTIVMHYNTGGVWSVIGTQSDSSVSGAGRVGTGTDDGLLLGTDFQLDNFSGGTVVVAVSSAPLLLLGVG